MPQAPEEFQDRPHPFERRPHREMARLSFPIFVALIAEPLTGMVDTAFIKMLGSSAQAALGAAAVVLSGLFWMFNFLAIGTQTEVSRAHGAGDSGAARQALSAALALAAGLGVLLILITWPFFASIAAWMGAEGGTAEGTITYLRIRILGAPAVLMTVAAMGAMRGIQDMKTPLRVAIFTNAINLVLDPLLIFGWGPVPAFGLGGAAAASAIAQWAGGALALFIVVRRVGGAGLRAAFDFAVVRRLLVIGGDLFVRTGTLMLFLILATRSAMRLGDEAGAAHQAIRTFWFFTALVLDAYAATAQSLIGYFTGSGRIEVARRVARVASVWAFTTGVLLTLVMIATESWIASLLVSPAAVVWFSAPWLASALAQPLNALSFVTDGIHWGTKDYRYLRNVMLLASGTLGAAMIIADASGKNDLVLVWILTGIWITVRATFGMLRVWPGIGNAPLRADKASTL